MAGPTRIFPDVILDRASSDKGIMLITWQGDLVHFGDATTLILAVSIHAVFSLRGSSIWQLLSI